MWLASVREKQVRGVFSWVMVSPCSRTLDDVRWLACHLQAHALGYHARYATYLKPSRHALPTLHWQEAGQNCSARWRSERGALPPKKVVLADDTMTADAAYRLACEGTALLWRGDFQNARQMLQAMARRADESGKTDKRGRKPKVNPLATKVIAEGVTGTKASAGFSTESTTGPVPA